MATNRQLEDRALLTASVEDYVKAIYTLEGIGKEASTNALAARLDVTAPRCRRWSGSSPGSAWSRTFLTAECG